MSKKKKKRAGRIHAGGRVVPSQVGGRHDNDMMNEIHHASDLHFTLYAVSNGYMLAAFFRKRRPDGDVIGAYQEVTYVPTLDEVPKAIATQRAAFVIK